MKITWPKTTINRTVWMALALGSLFLLGGSITKTLPLDLTEVFGFVTGAYCVWLVVKENIWNWPVGIANAMFFVALFWQSKLYADMGLNVVYVILGVLGWYWWLRGGEHKQALKVRRTSLITWIWVGVATVIFTAGMTMFLRSVSDAAPFLDAITTALSLAAQYLLTRKLIENWWLWIAADIIYVGLYIWKGLPLTGILYAIFLIMSISGLVRWERTHRAQNATAEPLIQVLES